MKLLRLLSVVAYEREPERWATVFTAKVRWKTRAALKQKLTHSMLQPPIHKHRPAMSRPGTCQNRSSQTNSGYRRRSLTVFQFGSSGTKSQPQYAHQNPP